MQINGHRTKISMDASSYDEICEKCGATDGIGTMGRLAYPCPIPDKKYLCSACSSGNMHDRISCLGTAATEDGRPVSCECGCGGA